MLDTSSLLAQSEPLPVLIAPEDRPAPTLAARLLFPRTIRAQTPGFPACRTGTFLDLPRPNQPTAGVVRQKFRKMAPQLDTIDMRTLGNHPHAVLAADRERCHKRLVQIARHCGFEPYEISWSKRSTVMDVKDGYHGHFTGRDEAWAERNDVIRADHCVIGIDVDYYMTPADLSHSGQPILLYSFCPDERNGSHREANWTIEDSGISSLDVKGGGNYRHYLWDWTRNESVTVACHSGWTREYAVDWERSSKTHVMVCLTPLRLNPPPGLFPRIFECCEIDIGRTAPPPLARVRYDAGIRISGDHVALSMGHSSARVPVAAHDAISVRFKTSKDVGVGSVQQILAAFGVDKVESLSAASMYVALHRTNQMPSGQLHLYSRFVEDSRGSPLIEEIENARPTFVETANPPTDLPVFAPLATVSNALAATVERIEEVRQPFLADPAKVREYMKEFVHECLRRADVDPGTVIALTLEELKDRTSKASTKARIQGVSDNFILATNALVKAFMKRELYKEDKKPRNISAVDSENIALMGQFAYALKDQVLSKLPWFLPGLTPPAIGKIVNEYCVKNAGGEMFATDYSSFDGTTNRDIRELEVMFFEIACADPAAAELVRREIDGVHCMTAGHVYDCHGTRKSGSALTTIMNTVQNGFAQFYAGRERGLPVAGAFDAIGPCCGDDGLGTEKSLPKASKQLGYTVKMVPVCTIDHPEVDLLGRVYPTPLENAGSFQDPARVWCKFGAVENVEGVDPEFMLRLKIESFAITDGTTPVLAAYCAAFLRCSRVHRRYKVAAHSRSYLEEALGISASNTWPGVDAADPRVREVYARNLGVPVSALDEADARIAAATRLSDLRHLFVFGAEVVCSNRSNVRGRPGGPYEPVRFVGKRGVGRTAAPVTRSDQNGKQPASKPPPRAPARPAPPSEACSAAPAPGQA